MSCAAPYCNNSAAKEYTMKRLPRNLERQAMWVKNINRRLDINKQFTSL